MRTRTLVIVSAVVVLVLAAASTIAIGATRGHRETVGFGRRSSPGTNCTVPNLPGTVVNVTLVNAGGPMMANGHGGMMGGVAGGMMRLTATPATVPAGQVSFVATNMGSVNHELVVLPLPANQIVGTRTTEGDGTVDESGSLGEASNSCGAGAGDGIAPGASSWATVTLAAGRFELVCNLPGHYAAGMYTQVTVR
jgi:uncharacterized cupredoxin-like copper-binding protein